MCVCVCVDTSEFVGLQYIDTALRSMEIIKIKRSNDRVPLLIEIIFLKRRYLSWNGPRLLSKESAMFPIDPTCVL